MIFQRIYDVVMQRSQYLGNYDKKIEFMSRHIPSQITAMKT
jgi:hypothetical protein